MDRLRYRYYAIPKYQWLKIDEESFARLEGKQGSVYYFTFWLKVVVDKKRYDGSRHYFEYGGSRYLDISTMSDSELKEFLDETEMFKIDTPAHAPMKMTSFKEYSAGATPFFGESEESEDYDYSEDMEYPEKTVVLLRP